MMRVRIIMEFMNEDRVVRRQAIPVELLQATHSVQPIELSKQFADMEKKYHHLIILKPFESPWSDDCPLKITMEPQQTEQWLDNLLSVKPSGPVWPAPLQDYDHLFPNPAKPAAPSGTPPPEQSPGKAPSKRKDRGTK